MLTQNAICTKFKQDKKRHIKITAEGAVCSWRTIEEERRNWGKRGRKVSEPEVGKQLNKENK